MVKSDLLIGVKLKLVLTMGDKFPGVRTPLKETNIVPNVCCRICRIYVKISDRSKINVFGYNTKDFLQILSSVLSADVHADDSTGLFQIIYLSDVPAGSCNVCKSLTARQGIGQI